MNEAKFISKIFEGQLLHYLLLTLLVFIISWFIKFEDFKSGIFLGVPTSSWITLVVLNAVTHQIYVWFCWRVELHEKLLTRWFRKKAFRLYAFGFAVLIIFRPLLAFFLGWSNRNTLPINSLTSYTLSVICFCLTAYLMYSVVNYFSFKRAFGIDHFEIKYKDIPFERRGIFRITPNAMYVFGFLALWLPAFLFQSFAALILAIFSHIYIWVHYFTTEKPDMKSIYGKED